MPYVVILLVILLVMPHSLKPTSRMALLVTMLVILLVMYPNTKDHVVGFNKMLPIGELNKKKYLRTSDYVGIAK